jgi:hypothetical protein
MERVKCEFYVTFNVKSGRIGRKKILMEVYRKSQMFILLIPRIMRPKPTNAKVTESQLLIWCGPISTLMVGKRL